MMVKLWVSSSELHTDSNFRIRKDNIWVCHAVTLKFQSMTTWRVQCLEMNIHWTFQKEKMCHKAGEFDGIVCNCSEGIKLGISCGEVLGTTIIASNRFKLGVK